MSAAAPRPHRILSPITLRILAVNVVALALLVIGILYLGEYRQRLIDAELSVLTSHAEMVAGALAEGALTEDETHQPIFAGDAARRLLGRLVEASGARARLFAVDGALVVDSRLIGGQSSVVRIEELPPPRKGPWLIRKALDALETAATWLPGRGDLAPYRERPNQQNAADFGEAVVALEGENGAMVRGIFDGNILLSVAVPVQRYKQVLGAVMLSRVAWEIEDTLYEVRVDILTAFGLALAATIAASLYLAGTVARPLRRLAEAAERVRREGTRQHAIPDLTDRADEIGDLSASLREMTAALWSRLDAIERFAADVAHEIKNPLTSLRSAVETLGMIQDNAQRQRLLGVIRDDVDRLDRLISDISDASRLDAELSRAEFEPVDLGGILTALVEVHALTAKPGAPSLILAPRVDDAPLVVPGIEGRLVQVLRNLIGNAVSFSPPGGTITLAALREGTEVVVQVDDQGPGLPEGKEETVFERFYSERPQGEKFGTHSGLGLAISKQIVEVHNGTLTAANLQPRGARFTLRLPIA